jgi:hypothetical protein
MIKNQINRLLGCKNHAEGDKINNSHITRYLKRLTKK